MFELDIFGTQTTSVFVTLAAVVITYIIIKIMAPNQRKYDRIDIRGKTVLVTGANGGIGKETVRELSNQGARVILACRNHDRGQAAADEVRSVVPDANLVVKTVDLAVMESVKKFADEILAEESCIDILINNAAVFATAKQLNDDGTEFQFNTNHLGHYLLTRLLLPLIEQSDVKRIAVVSSKMYRFGDIRFSDDGEMIQEGGMKQYNNTKLMNCLFVREIHRRYVSRGVSAFAIHPGIANTNLSQSLTSHGIGYLLKPFINLFFYMNKTPEQGSRTSVYCATAAGLEEQSGSYFTDSKLSTWDRVALDEEMALKVWDCSEAKVQAFL